jgi:hypothetical protein
LGYTENVSPALKSADGLDFNNNSSSASAYCLIINLASSKALARTWFSFTDANNF